MATELHVVHLVLLYVFSFLVPSCDVRYDFRLNTIFGSSLLPVVCMMAHVLLCCLCSLVFICSGVQQFVLLYVFMVLVPCCDIRYGFDIKAVFLTPWIK